MPQAHGDRPLLWVWFPVLGTDPFEPFSGEGPVLMACRFFNGRGIAGSGARMRVGALRCKQGGHGCKKIDRAESVPEEECL